MTTKYYRLSLEVNDEGVVQLRGDIPYMTSTLKFTPTEPGKALLEGDQNGVVSKIDDTVDFAFAFQLAFDALVTSLSYQFNDDYNATFDKDGVCALHGINHQQEAVKQQQGVLAQYVDWDSAPKV